MKNAKAIYLSCLVWAVLLGALAAEGRAEPQLTSKVSSQTIDVDDRLILKLEVQWPKEEGEYSFMPPDVPSKNLLFKLRGESEETFSLGGRIWSKKTFNYEFAPSGPGQAFLGPSGLPFVKSSTGEQGNLEIPEIQVKVKKQIDWKIALAAAFLAGGMCALLGTHLLKRKRTGQTEAPVIPPEQRAAEAIRQLPLISSDQESLSKGGVVFHAYLQQKFNLASPAFELGDLDFQMEKAGMDSGEQKKVRRIVEKFREARYSGTALSASEVRDLLHESAAWIERRKIVDGQAGTKIV